MLPSPKATPATADAPMSPTSEIKFKQKLLIYRLENASTNSHDCSEHAAPQDVAASARKGLLDQSNLPSFPDGDDFYYVCQSPANQHKEIRSTVLSQSHKGFHDGDVNYTCSLSDLVSRTDSSSVDNRENFAAAIQQIRDLVARGNVTTTALQHTSLISNLLDFVQVYSPTHLKRKHEEQLHDTLLQQCLYLMMHLLRGPSLLHTMDMLQLQQLLQLAGESADSRVALHATGVVHSCLARQTKLLKAMAATRLSLGLLSRLQSTASAKLAGALAAVLVKVAAERQGLHVLLKHDAMRICGCALQRWLDDHQAATRPNVLGPLLSLTATLLWNNEQALEQFMQNNGASILVSSFRRSACDPGLAKQTADVIHHVLSVPSSGSLCLHAGLLQVMIDALTSDEMASSVIASFAHLLPQVFTLPALHQSLEHTDQFTTVCTLLLRQQRLEPDTWPTFSSLLTTMATFEPCLRVMHDLAFASLLSDHLACLELAPTSDELGLLLRLAIPPSTSECDGEAAASKPSKHTQDCLGAVVSTVLRTCSSSTVAHPLQRQAASYMCQICSEERHHQALCEEGCISRLLAVLQLPHHAQDVLLLLMAALDSLLKSPAAAVPFQEADGMAILMQAAQRQSNSLDVLQAAVHAYWCFCGASSDFSPSSTVKAIAFLNSVLTRITAVDYSISQQQRQDISRAIVGACKQLARHDHLLMMLRDGVPVNLVKLLEQDTMLELAQDALYIMSRIAQDTLVARQLGQRGLATWLKAVQETTVHPEIRDQAHELMISIKRIVEAERWII